MADFVIAGGGIGGLVLARRLVLGGASVTVIEANGHLGGTVTSHTVGGIVLDAGAESFATRGGTVEKLARSLRLGDDVVMPLAEGAWLQPASGPAFRLPENSFLGIPGSPLASDVVAILGARSALRAFLETLLPGSVGSRSVTLGQLVRRRMGADVLDKLVRPIVRGVHSADPDDLKLEHIAPRLLAQLRWEGSLARAVLAERETSARAGSAVAGIRGGVHRLVDSLAQDMHRFGVDVRLGQRVTAVEPSQLRIESDAGADVVEGRVVVAAPGLLGPATGGKRVVLATLVVDVPELDAAPRGTGVLVAEGAPGIRARALTHATAKWSWLAEAAGGRHVLRLSYDAEDAAGADLANVARADASALMGVDIPATSVQDFARVAWYRPGRQTHTPDGILAVGESIAGTGLAGIIAQAEATAAEILADSAE